MWVFLLSRELLLTARTTRSAGEGEGMIGDLMTGEGDR